MISLSTLGNKNALTGVVFVEASKRGGPFEAGTEHGKTEKCYAKVGQVE
jgi:hypothetical protein